MDPITHKLVPGAAGFIEKDYVNDVFSVDTWFGTGNFASVPANKKITNGINMAQHGGMVLNFVRGNKSGNHGTDYYKAISDTDIGVGKRFWPLSNTNALGTEADAMQSFDSDGWTMGKNLHMNEGYNDNTNSSQNGAYTFRKCPGFFDMVTFTTGDGSNKQANRRISHNLKCKVGFMILKNQDSTQDYYVFNCKQQGGGANDYAKLNQTDNWTGSSDFWGPQGADTTNDFGLNENAVWWIANCTYSVWLWADGDDPNAAIFGQNSDASIVKQVHGGGGANAFTNIGWEPQMLLIKNEGSDWCWFDSLRGTAFQSSADSFAPYNGVSMFSNNDSAESAGYGIGFNATGWYNSTFGGNCTCLAIRRPDADCGRWAKTPAECLHIHKGAEPSTENFNLNTIVDASNNPTGFGIHDMEISARRYGGTTNWYNTNRMMSGSSNNDGGMSTANNESGFSRYYLSTTNDAYLSQQQASLRNIRYDLNSVQLTATPSISGSYIPPDGWGNNSGGAGQNAVFYMFRRQPAFFDMIKYNGYTNVPTTHKLGVIPDLVIVKSLTNNSSSSYGNYWGVWSKAAADANIGASSPTLNYHAWFNHVNSVQAQGFNLWSTVPTATTLDIATGHPNDSNVTSMMYLFANREGISKFGIYTGLGSGNVVTVNDVGFSPRLLIIKNLTTSGGQDYWFVYDTKRGFTSSNNPYLILNEANSEVTGTDYVDPLSNGFQLTNSAIDNFNRNGDKFLYLAFA
jgi:hypothetical protein